MMGADILTDGSLTLDNFSGFDPSNAHRSSYRCYRMAMGMPMGAQAGGAVVGNVNVQGPVVVPQAAAAGSPAVSPASLAQPSPQLSPNQPLPAAQPAAQQYVYAPQPQYYVQQDVRAIHAAIQAAAAARLQQQINNTWPRIWEIIFRAVMTSSASASITSGKLRIDFGITTNPVGDIAKWVADTLSIRVTSDRRADQNILANVTLKLLPNDYTSLFMLPSVKQPAVYTRTGQDVPITLPWLYWLLTLGQQIIITGYGVSYGSKGRTGGGNMNKREAPFKVDSQFAGTQDDNFITRALKGAIPEIQNALIQGFS